jgi:hypothetical protein
VDDVTGGLIAKERPDCERFHEYSTAVCITLTSAIEPGSECRRV